jgi:hypothetical protein
LLISEIVLIPLISKKETKRTTTTRKIIQSKDRTRLISSLKPMIVPTSNKIIPEPFHIE